MGRARWFKMADSDSDEAENQALQKGEKRRQEGSDQESDDDSSSEANTDASDESFDENMVRIYHLDVCCSKLKEKHVYLCIGADLRIAGDYGFYVFACTRMHLRLVQFTLGSNGACCISVFLVTLAYAMKSNMALYIEKL